MAVQNVPRSAASELAGLLDSPEIAALVSELEQTRWTGRPGYPIRSMVGMCLAKSLYAIPTWSRTARLVAEHSGLQAVLGCKRIRVRPTIPLPSVAVQPPRERTTMATKGTRNTAISFGEFEVAVAMKRARGSRDVKTELVDVEGRPIKRSGGSGTSRGVNAEAGEARAVRISDEKVIRLPQAELEAIEEESKRNYATMKVLETIDYRQVPTERICEAYWLQPAQGTARGLRLLAEGLRRTGRVAIVKWCSNAAHGREHLGVIRVRHRGEKIALLLSELVFAGDFAEPDEDALSINEVEPTERELAAAERLVKAHARREEPKVDTASDEAVDARRALVDRLQGEDLEQSLEASVNAQREDVRTQWGDEVADEVADRSRAQFGVDPETGEVLPIASGDEPKEHVALD